MVGECNRIRYISIRDATPAEDTQQPHQQPGAGQELNDGQLHNSKLVFCAGKNPRPALVPALTLGVAAHVADKLGWLPRMRGLLGRLEGASAY